MAETNAHSLVPKLIRKLGLWAATAVLVGSMIPQSVFLVAGDVARQLRSPLGCVAFWFAGGIVVLLGAFCYAELGAAMPETGGDYVYLSRGISSTCDFLYGWTGSIILKPGSAAIIASGFSRLAAFLSPSFATSTLVWRPNIFFASHSYRITLSKAQLWAVALVVRIQCGSAHCAPPAPTSLGTRLSSLGIWTPYVFGMVALAASANLWWVSPVRSSIGAAIILLGLPFFYYWRRQACGADQAHKNRQFVVTAANTNLRGSPWQAGR